MGTLGSRKKDSKDYQPSHPNWIPNKVAKKHPKKGVQGPKERKARSRPQGRLPLGFRDHWFSFAERL